jgi:hypothetical protein
MDHIMSDNDMYAKMYHPELSKDRYLGPVLLYLHLGRL